MNGFDIQQTKLMIIQQTDSVDLIVSKYNYNNEGKIYSHLFPIKSSSPITIAGFKMEQYFCGTVLKDMQSYQGVLKNDHRFMSRFVLCINSASSSFFNQMLKPEMKDDVHMICANIMEALYKLLSLSSNGTVGFYGILYEFMFATYDNPDHN